ncbi:MAG TPA: ABC transporter substrate-binding protein, partial [Chloroflexota bacterium]
MAAIRVGVNNGTGKIYANVTLSTFGRGHFKRHGLDVELVELGGRREMVPLLAKDELEVASQGPSYEFFAALDPQKPMVMAADHGSAREGRGGAGGIVARPDMIQSGKLRDFKDLRGKRIALSPKKYDHDWVTIGAALKRGGLTFDDVQVVTMDFGGGRHEGIVNGTIDIATVDRP